MSELSVYFYGRFSSVAKRDAERLAREAGYKTLASLGDGPRVVVLGEEAPIAQTRARLAEEFDARSRDAFESGALEILSETEFLERARARIASDDGKNIERSEPLFEALESENAAGAQEQPLYTPAAVAELVGVSIASVRRWYRRGFLTATFQRDRLPLFSTREVLVARRLAFLFSGDLAEEFVARRLLAFAGLSAPRGAEFDALREASFDVGAVILQTTLSSDGREPLFLGVNGPIDGEGQRRFEFNAFPTDGSFETPEPPPTLSPDEEQIALAERLASWNAKETALSGKPAFLTLFQPSEDETSEKEPDAAQAREEPRETFAPKGIDVVAQCERAWNLEREGYWEEAERAYRDAALAGGHEANVCFRLGKILFLLGDYPAARERFYSALELDRGYVDAKFGLGKTFAALGELEEARLAFLDAIKEKQDDPALRVELGKLYLRLNRKEDAELEFRRAIDGVDDPKLADDIRRLLLALAVRN